MSIGNTIKSAFSGGKGPKVFIGDVEVSASISESHSLEADVTENPVESGSDINENYRQRSAPLSISGVVSNVKLETGYPGQTIIEAFRASKDNDPSLEAWRTIVGYFKDSTIITIGTSLQTYENMCLTSFRVDRDNRSKDALRFSCEAKQLRIVSTQTTDAISDTKTPEKAKSTSAKKKPDQKGKQEGSEATGEKKTSALKGAANKFFK